MKPYFETKNGVLYHGDCMDIMEGMDDNSVDLVLTDPPYGIADNYLKPSAKGEWSKLYSVKIEWDNFAPQVTIERSLAVGKNAIIWGGNYFMLPPMRGWLIWDKMQKHTSGHAELAYTNLDIPIRNYAYCRAQLANEGKQHPTQKPLGLFRWCISLCNCETVLDPFLGSGTTAIACEQLNRKWIGIEREEQYCEIAAKRLSEPMQRSLLA